MADQTYLLNKQSDLLKAFYLLMNTAGATGSTPDDGLTEQDVTPGTSAEAAKRYVMQGLWAAQYWWLDTVDPYRWLTTSAALTFSGADSTGGRYVALPIADGTAYLRIASTKKTSGLRSADGIVWGQQIDPEDRFNVWGQFFYFMNEQLWLARGAAPPTGTVMDYHHKHAQLVDDNTAIDFDLPSRPLSVAFSAYEAMHDGWSVADPTKIMDNLNYWKTTVASRARRTRQPQRIRKQTTRGTHWFVS